jgi:anti-sigma B factor antagonist
MTISPSMHDVPVVAHRDLVRVAPEGELDMATCEPVAAMLDELWDSGWTDVVLDLREVTFADSTTLHLLVCNQRRAERDGTRFRIIDRSHAVQRILTISGLRHVLDFMPEERVRSM